MIVITTGFPCSIITLLQLHSFHNYMNHFSSDYYNNIGFLSQEKAFCESLWLFAKYYLQIPSPGNISGCEQTEFPLFFSMKIQFTKFPLLKDTHYTVWIPA